jgi:hypothetical protein
MNKLLPILLAVVLSGCGGTSSGTSKSSLEICADSYVELHSFLYNKIELTNDEYGLCGNATDRVRCNMQTRQNVYKSRPLEIKLKDFRYEKDFQQCELNKNKYPETFKSKWK